MRMVEFYFTEQSENIFCLKLIAHEQFWNNRYCCLQIFSALHPTCVRILSETDVITINVTK